MCNVKLYVNGTFWRKAEYAGLPSSVMVGIVGSCGKLSMMSADVVDERAHFDGPDISIDKKHSFYLRKGPDESTK